MDFSSVSPIPHGSPIAGLRPSPYRLPATAEVGRVRLAVSNLQRSTEFYTRVIGLSLLNGDTFIEESLARLGVQATGEVLLELEAQPGVHPIVEGTRLGLYHTAFLLPSRTALASFILHLRTAGVPFGSSDHRYSEALYFKDPDGLSVEVYADRPREQWEVEGQELVTGVEPLRFNTLPNVSHGSWTGVPYGTRIGHVHLYIGDLDRARKFYHNGLGLDIMTWRYPGALFTSAGGYHHHVGLNVWASGSPQASHQDARLLFWELRLPSVEELQKLQANMERSGFNVVRIGSHHASITDPWGIKVVLVGS